MRMSRFLIALAMMAVLTFMASPIIAADLQGTLRNSSGTPLSNMRVDIFGASSGITATVHTDQAGNYLFTSLPQDQYRIYYSTADGSDGAWYGAGVCTTSPATVDLQSTATVNYDFSVLSVTGTIKGTVTDINGTPLSGIWVTAQNRDSEQALVNTETDANGNYSMTVPAGDRYIVFFFPFTYVPEYFDNVPISNPNNANDIVVGANQTVIANASLQKGGSIKGVVKDSCGVPVNGAVVKLTDQNGLLAGSATTDQSGTGVYEFSWVLPGSYKVSFESSDSLARQWYPGQQNESAAGVLTVVSDGVITGIDGTLQIGSIAGRATDSLGNGIQYFVTVKLFDTAGLLVASTTPTDSNGNYSFSAVKAGAYKVYFDYNNGCSSEWATDKYSYDTAELVTVTACNQTIVNSSLGGFSVSGVVTSSGGFPLQGVAVSVYDAVSGMTMGTATTDANGIYSIASIPGGTYKVYFKTTTASEYLSSWNIDKSDFSFADLFVLAAPKVIDAVLQKKSAIAGTVYDQNNVGISGVKVEALDKSTGIAVSSVYSTNTGTYLLPVPSAGAYKLRFNGMWNTSADIAYIEEYYNDRALLADADIITVNSAEITSGIDAVLASYVKIAGKIRGRVVDSNNIPLSGVTVQAINSITGLMSRSTTTDIDGNYTVGLTVGTYKIKFIYYNQTIYKNFEQWYNQQKTVDTAEVLTVTEGNEILDINAVYPALGQITGNIKVVLSCKPRITTNATACAYSTATKKQISCGYTDSNGNYSITLEPGDYKILFKVYDNERIARKWFGDSYDSSTAATVTVLSGSATSSVNTLLFTDAGKVQGKIADSSGKPVEPFCNNNSSYRASVAIYDSNQYWIETVDVDSLGNYSISQLPPGNYKANVGSWSSLSYYYGTGKRFNATWYNGQPDFNSATIIPLNRNSVAIDFTAEILVPHSIQASSTAGGTISPSGSTTIKPGGTAAYIITANPGYVIADVLVDSTSVGAVGAYSFSNVLADHTIQAIFQEFVVDVEKPAITAFTLAPISNRFSVPVTLTATDNTSVTGYCVVETADPASCSWSVQAPSSFIFASPGLKTLYAFARDGAGNISSPLSATTDIILPRLTIQMSGAGSGTVSRNPAGIVCSTGDCTALYENETTVSLLPTESVGSVFFGWSGACSGSSACSLVMDADKNVTASFAIFNPIVKLDSQPPSYYLALSTAYAAIADSTPATVLLQEGHYNEDLISDRPVELDLKGGFGHDFTTASGYSSVNSMTLAAGSLVIDRLIIASQSGTPTETPSTILMLDGAEPLLFSTFKAAIDVIPEYSAATIKAGIGILDGGVDLNRDIQLKLLGGFDSTLTKQDGYLHIRGGLVITLGSLTVDGIILE